VAAALGRVGGYEFPFELNAITHEYFARTAALSQGDLAADARAVGANGQVDTAAARRLANRSPFYNAPLRTTCVATLIEGGHAVNALPQRAVATINCRILPGVDPTTIEQNIRRVAADSAVMVTRADTATPSPPSPLPASLEQTIRSVTASVWGRCHSSPQWRRAQLTDSFFETRASLSTAFAGTSQTRTFQQTHGLMGSTSASVSRRSTTSWSSHTDC